ncbi:glycosyltransferase family 39 protein, partial [Patescibacteria group bacterium]|nr:glycosyltransferase family 39 protein [Patescibacteria group bacterium]
MFNNLLLQNYITRGFWGDEAWTAVISRLSIPEIIQVTGQDFHPPLYYLIVHGFMQVFGESEWIRIISTIFFLLTLIPVYVFAKKIVNKTVAWVSTLLVA